VFPIYNEDAVIALLVLRLKQLFKTLPDSFEVIFVNDGSRDRSLEMLRETARDNEWARVVSLSRNFGHQTAVSAGLTYATGSAVIVMDADLQDPPELIPEMLKLWRSGSSVVYCVRKKRKEGIVKRASYAAFYRIMRMMVDMEMPLDSGDFCLMDARVVKLICSMPERNRFIRGLRAWVGFKQTPLEYERSARQAGEPKYNMRRLMKLAMDGIFSFSYVPLKICGTVGITIAIASLVYTIKIILWRIAFNDRVPGFATLATGMFFFASVQLLSLYVIGEYLGRIYDEAKQRPTFIVEELQGFPNQ